MPPNFKIVKFLEWCTELPVVSSRKSPCFSVNGHNFYFNYVVHKISTEWLYTLYLESVSSQSTVFKQVTVKFEAGFSADDTLSLSKRTFMISNYDRKDIWSTTMNKMRSALPPDYTNGNFVKFRFQFDTVEECLLKMSKVDDKSVQTPLYIDTNFELNGVSKDLSTLLDEGPNHDVEFICGDQTIKAHKNVLGCRSEVFATMFRTEMAEGRTGQVKIQDIEGTIFELFLRYLYTGMLPELTVDTALQIYEVADKYNVLVLKKKCASFLVEHLSPENACEILIISDRHSDPDFKKDVMEYVVQGNVPFRGETLSNFCKDNCKVAAEVLNLLCQQLPEKKEKS